MNTEQPANNVYKPSLKAYKAWLGGTSVLAVAFAAALFLPVISRNGIVVAVIVFVSALIIAGLIILVAFRGSRITLTDSELIYKSVFRTRRFAFDNTEGTLISFVGPETPNAIPAPINMLLIKPRSSKRFTRLNGAFWNQHNLELFASKLKVENLLAQGPLSVKTLRKTHPQYLKLSERHTAAFVIITVLVSLIVIATGIYILAGVQQGFIRF